MQLSAVSFCRTDLLCSSGLHPLGDRGSSRDRVPLETRGDAAPHRSLAVRLKRSIGRHFSRAPKVDTEDPEGAATVRRRAAHAPIAPASAEVKVDLEKHGERLQYTF